MNGRYARHGLNCLLFGPRGVGKEVDAGYYVQTYSRQKGDKNMPFVSLNCAGISGPLVKYSPSLNSGIPTRK